MEHSSNLLLLFLVFPILLFGRVLYVLYAIKRNLRRPFEYRVERDNDVKTMIIIGSGGHTAEMVAMVTALGDNYSPRHYVAARTDKMSEDKIHKLQSDIGLKNKPYHVHKVPRSREVGQSYLTSVVSTIYSILYSIPLVFSVRPDLVLTNGPGTCIPLCGAAFLLKVLCIKDVRIVFIESICRVETLSLTGKLLYYLADHLLVQWPQLAENYPRTRFIGRIV